MITSSACLNFLDAWLYGLCMLCNQVFVCLQEQICPHSYIHALRSSCVTKDCRRFHFCNKLLGWESFNLEMLHNLHCCSVTCIQIGHWCSFPQCFYRCLNSTLNVKLYLKFADLSCFRSNDVSQSKQHGACGSFWGMVITHLRLMKWFARIQYPKYCHFMFVRGPK